MVDLNLKKRNITIKEVIGARMYVFLICLLCNIHHKHMHPLHKDHALIFEGGLSHIPNNVHLNFEGSLCSNSANI